MEGVGEEKVIDTFNVSEGQEALELASEESFMSLGSPPTPADNNSVNRSLSFFFFFFFLSLSKVDTNCHTVLSRKSASPRKKQGKAVINT